MRGKFAKAHQPSPHIIQMTPPVRASGQGMIVIFCADSRVPCDQILGFDEQISITSHRLDNEESCLIADLLDPAVIRNAGGLVSDAMRMIAVMQSIISPGYIVVMHHTDCGMTHFLDPTVRETLLKISPSKKDEIEAMEFGEIRGSIENSVREDIDALRGSPLIKKGTQLIGTK